MRVCIDPWSYLFAAAALLILPVKWILGAFLAAAFHELCHIALIFALGGTVRRISIRPAGAEICVDPMTKGKELLCAAAGPAGSLLMCSFGHWFPELALCGFIQGIFNLLPIYPLDGGRIVRCLIAFFSPERAERITTRLSAVAAIALAAVSIAYGFLPGFLLFAGMMRASLRKIPCKEGKLAVQ